MITFADFFRTAIGHDPYPYQRRLAEEDPLPQLLNIPTGAGKTAAAVCGFGGPQVSDAIICRGRAIDRLRSDGRS